MSTAQIQPAPERPRAADILVRRLVEMGADTAFCVAGESYLDVLDAFYTAKSPRMITCRHEGAAAFMAEAHGKLTGKPGICFVTRGPGACNASIGVHTARQDSTPMILFIGQVPRRHSGREAFQEIDFRAMFGPVAKGTFRVADPARMGEIVTSAWTTAMSGRPGPVIVELPEDILREEVTDDAPEPPVQADPAPWGADMVRLAELLNAAERPLVITGGNLWRDETTHAMEALAEQFKLPVVAAFRRQDTFANTHDCYIGDLGTGANPALHQRVREADVIIALGTRLNDMANKDYGLITAPVPKQTLIHIHPDPDELNRNYRARLAICATPEKFVDAFAKCAITPNWQNWLESGRADYLQWSTPQPDANSPYAVDMDAVFAVLKNKLPADAIVTTDAGNFSCWAQRYLHHARPGRMLAPTSGAMGYAVPSCISAAINKPDKIAVGLAGDGGFMMTAQDIATAVQAGAAPVIIVFDNGVYGTIRMHQQKRFPGHVSATQLTNPDFAAYAQSFGAQGMTVKETKDFEKALDAAFAERNKPTLIHVLTDAEQTLPGKRLSDL